MTIKEALEVLQKQYNCWTTVSLECPIQCEKCENRVGFADFLEALKTVLDAFGNCSELPNSSDLVSRSYLLAEYDRQHEGPPGGARKIIEEAPAVLRNSEMSESLKFEEIGKSVRAGFESGIRNWFTDTEKDFEVAYSAQDFCSNDLISRQAAIDVIEDIETARLQGEIGMIYAPAIKGLRALPSVQAEQTDDTEFWKKRAKDYENTINDLISKMTKGVKFNCMEMNAEGLTFREEKPSVQAERKKGKWIPVDEPTINGRCSVCGFESHLWEDDVYGYDYCPNCGARLEVVDE